jgi:competence ComEA-like helix-hairpin-helix protein
MAKRIAADRALRGRFGSLSGLDRVPGIGPGLLRTLEPHVVFDGGPAGGTAGGHPAGVLAVVSCEARQQVTSNDGETACSPARLSLNHATALQLDALPGIGRARAAAIVQYRERNGPFGTVADLARVPGINPALLQRLFDRLQVP